MTNLKKAVHGILNDYNTLLMEIWLSMEEFGFVRYFEDLLGSLHEYVWPYSLLLRGYFTHLVSLIVFCNLLSTNFKKII